jgi:hypothetical protein
MDNATEQFLRDWAQQRMPDSTGAWAGPYNKVSWSTPVIEFVHEVLVEGFELRRAEPTARQLGLDLRGPLSLQQVESILRSDTGDAIAEMLQDALERAAFRRELNLQNQDLEVLLVDVLGAINARWCRVWPFCNPARAPKP